MARWFSWLECRPVTAEVVGSSPIRVAICGNSSVVEHLLAKEGVASSNLVFRSIFRGIAQLVEYRSPKPLVVGSIPTAPATKKCRQSLVFKGFDGFYFFTHIFQVHRKRQ